MSLVDSIIGAESGGDPSAKNPYSSASGPGQFLDSTWVATVRAHRPDLANKSDADLLAMKTDPALGREMTEAYAQDNQAYLTKNGLQATPGNTYLAHFAGPQGAVKVLQADPNTPVGQILGDSVVKANPFLKGMTAADLQGWASKKMGQSAPPTPSQAPLSVPQMTQPVFAQAPQAPPQAAPQAIPQMPQGAGPGAGGQAGGSPQFEVPQGPPIFYAPRRAPNLAGLQQALGNRGLPYFGKG